MKFGLEAWLMKLLMSTFLKIRHQKFIKFLEKR